MIFRAKRDRTFLITVAVVIFFHNLVGIALGILLADHATHADLLVLFSVFVLSTLLMLWCVYDIKYVFGEDHLLLQSGPFRHRIPYGNITGAKPVTFTLGDMLVGYRILSAKDGIVITYAPGLMGEVKISPKDVSLFLAELEKRRNRLK